MRPVLFDYAHAQKSGNFKEVIYDYEDDLSKIEGKTIVERSQVHAAYVTKTKVQREADDTPCNELMGVVTKTDVQREADDSPRDELVNSATKTFVARESDDTEMDSYIALLTKTKSAIESDE